jgi:gamma-glutamyl-gamma-aminobutyrate hydrolase PuuD
MQTNKGFIAVTMDAGFSNDRDHDYLNREYSNFITGLGYTPLLIPNTEAAVEILGKIEVKGIIFSGGSDIGLDYASIKKDQAVEVSQARDDQESNVLDFALKNNIPIFGICRGMQFLNVKFGGDLISDLSSISKECVRKHDRNEHDMILTKENEKIRINSFHHQGFKESMTAPDFEILAISPDDGVVEAFRHNCLPILAVQWHPERPNGAMDWLKDKIEELFKK